MKRNSILSCARTTLAVAAAAASTAVPLAPAGSSAAWHPRLPVRIAAAGHPADVDPGFTVHSVTLGRSSVAIKGLNAVKVPVTLRASHTHPVRDSVRIATVIFTPDRRYPESIYSDLMAPVELRTTGTQPGTWTGNLVVPAAADGTLKVTHVIPIPPFVDYDYQYDETPFDGPSLTVTGTHIPRISARATPDPFRRAVDRTYRISGQVIDTATGAPYRHSVAVEMCREHECGWTSSSTSRTGADGRFSFTQTNNSTAAVNAQRIDRAHYLGLPSVTRNILGTAENLATSTVIIRKQAAISAVPSTTSASAGRSFTVDGKVWEVPAYRPVAIQQAARVDAVAHRRHGEGSAQQALHRDGAHDGARPGHLPRVGRQRSDLGRCH